MFRAGMVAMLALVAFGQLAWPGSGHAQEPACATPVIGHAPAMVQTGTETRFWGGGDQVSDPFHLDAGLTIVHVAAPRALGFVDVSLYGPDGREYGLWLFTLAPYDGSTAGELRTAGDYRLAVEFDGPWTVTLSQP